MSQVNISDSLEDYSLYSSLSIHSYNIIQESVDAMTVMCMILNFMELLQQSYWRSRSLFLNKYPEMGEFNQMPYFT